MTEPFFEMSKENFMNDIRIRNATLEDAKQILEIYAYYVEYTAITFEYDVPALANFQNRMENIMQRYPYLVIEKDGKIQGYAYAGPFKERDAYDWSCETTIYLDPAVQKGGLGRKLYEELEKRLQDMGILNLYACIAYSEALAQKQLDSDPYLTLDSVRFHERMGYVLNGVFHHCGYKFGRWYDMCWMEKILHGQRDEGADLLSCDEAYESLDMVITDRHADECK